MHKKLIVLAGLASTSLALAQPKKRTPKPKDPTPAPEKKAPDPTPTPTPTPDPVPEKAPDKAPQSPPDKPPPSDTLGNGNPTDRPWATGVPEAEQKKALELFRDGNNLLNDGILAQAAAKYREALTHWKHPAIHYNLALSLLTLNQPLEVYENFTAAVKYGVAPLDKERLDKANEFIKIMETTAITTIEVTCSKPGGEVFVDDKHVFTAPGVYTAKVKAGKHIFTCEPGKNMQGYTAKARAPYIDPNTKYRVELKLYTTDELTRYHRRWERRWAPYAVVAGGVLVAGIGGILALSAQSSFDDFDATIKRCNEESGNSTGCSIDTGYGDKKSSGETKRTMSYVAYGVGGGAVAVGLVLAYLNRKTPYQIKGEDFEEQQIKNDEPKVSFTPVISPEMAGAAMVGSF